ncbi:50S ribosomal protein L29 [Rickettsiella grylli]|uniref:Large ribosomal subunit protein uL29 n=1 Tax=Rickettsiella grylli TaxID=59196 RepID=A8PNP6_9COXI|nr:50S ribosomal protein L29 [Rickettsiella grylli]EDP45756.1 ribosomal protein L29 [Rickettsiella grylli]OIZ99633.1 50S ribosomal protein L29 [Rickettsiella grylli]
MNKKELRGLSPDLLKDEIFKLGQEQFKLEAQHATHQLTATHRLKVVRRMLARSLTILHETTMGQKI